jgi:hypothetical protein
MPHATHRLLLRSGLEAVRAIGPVGDVADIKLLHFGRAHLVCGCVKQARKGCGTSDRKRGAVRSETITWGATRSHKP